MSRKLDVPHLVIEDMSGQFTRVGFEYANALHLAREERAGVVVVRTLRNIRVELDPSTIERVYVLDHDALKAIAHAESEAEDAEQAAASLESLGIGRDTIERTALSDAPRRPPGFD